MSEPSELPITEPTAEQVEAYERGRAAWRAGKPSTASPYELQTNLWRLWVRGWVQARRDERYGPRT